MSESAEEPLNLENLKQEYLELTREQIGSVRWTDDKKRRLNDLKNKLGIDQPGLTGKQRNALRRQGTADTPETVGGKPRPPLTPEESRLIVEVNQFSGKKR